MEPMTSTAILKAMVDANGHIQVLNGPTAKYITVCRSDGSALLEGDLPREILDDFWKQSFVWQDGEENAVQVAIFRLTNDGKNAGKKVTSSARCANPACVWELWPTAS
jgi:hypothetical protein